MGTPNPRDISAAFCRLYNARDKAGLIGLYQDDAVFTLDGETVARGKAQIATAITPFLDAPFTMVASCGACLEVGAIALVRTDWRLLLPNGAVEMTGSSAEVLALGADGLWRFAIDDASYASRPRAV